MCGGRLQAVDGGREYGEQVAVWVIVRPRAGAGSRFRSWIVVRDDETRWLARSSQPSSSEVSAASIMVATSSDASSA